MFLFLFFFQRWLAFWGPVFYKPLPSVTVWPMFLFAQPWDARRFSKTLYSLVKIMNWPTRSDCKCSSHQWGKTPLPPVLEHKVHFLPACACQAALSNHTPFCSSQLPCGVSQAVLQVCLCILYQQNSFPRPPAHPSVCLGILCLTQRVSSGWSSPWAMLSGFEFYDNFWGSPWQGE